MTGSEDGGERGDRRVGKEGRGVTGEWERRGEG